MKLYEVDKSLTQMYGYMECIYVYGWHTLYYCGTKVRSRHVEVYDMFAIVVVKGLGNKRRCSPVAAQGAPDVQGT